MLIRHILRDKGASIYSVKTEASLEDAARELETRRVGALVALDATGGLAGVLSERDIVRHIARTGCAALALQVSDCMTRAVVTVHPDESLETGLERMTDRLIRHLPVIENGRLLGVVSIGDLVKARIELAEAESAALREYIGG